jgi:hypothetical protein
MAQQGLTWATTTFLRGTRRHATASHTHRLALRAVCCCALAHACMSLRTPTAYPRPDGAAEGQHGAIYSLHWSC